jgi:CheY-like chemotaxis protein
MPAEGGTGLGLAISKQYVELMGGCIGVESDIGKGSVFHFEIPVVALPSEAAHVESRRGRVIGLAEGQPRYRILIAEDQPENRLLLHKLLEPLGFDLREAADGKEALGVFEAWHPDLIFMDIRMPVMDGLEATRSIKMIDTGAQTKIVAVTAHALEEERREIMAAGCDDFIRKPYEYTDVLDALTKHLGARFVFEKGQTQPTAAVQLQAAALADVPGELLNTLEQALIHLDIGAVDQAVEMIRGHNPSAADALASLAHDTEYGRMLKLIREARAVKPARADNEYNE